MPRLIRRRTDTSVTLAFRGITIAATAAWLSPSRDRIRWRSFSAFSCCQARIRSSHSCFSCWRVSRLDRVTMEADSSDADLVLRRLRRFACLRPVMERRDDAVERVALCVDPAVDVRSLPAGSSLADCLDCSARFGSSSGSEFDCHAWLCSLSSIMLAPSKMLRPTVNSSSPPCLR